MGDWKDPLLAKWWAGCGAKTREFFGDSSRNSKPTMTLLVLVNHERVIDPADTQRLCDLIDAELREGREAQRWRDMDAAPRDGRAVVLRRRGGKADIGEFHNGSWCFKTEYGISRWEEKWFTGWLQLPETDSP